MQANPNKQQPHDQFQDAQDQVLTYVLSEQISSSPLNKHRKNKGNKFTEKPKLQLVVLEKQPINEFNFRQTNKNTKKIQEHQGKIIKIGNVTFRSNFECGNINSVRLTAHNTYQIDLQKQTNSNRISGWFYFNVQGIKGEAHFVIRGFTKTSSLYNEGMKICYKDVKDMSKWRRGGTRISYTNSQDQNQEERGYQLRFSHFFKNTQITCIEFAYCFPYGLKKLSNLLNHVRQMSEVKVLGRSFFGQNIPLLQIGNKQSQKVIVLSARVHPGETVSSFIMEGFIKQLVGDNQYGKLLRSHFLFKIVPMLNPDGVVRGNYRFSGYGCDLNRKWRNCKQNSQPQIYFMRELIRQTNKEKKVAMYIDIHGHSRKKNVFFYGCAQKKNGSVNPLPKQFPFIMEKIYDAFKYQNCCFAIQKDKQGTARITVWKDLRIDYVYTLESSFCGSQYGPNYLQADLQKIGKKLCEGITCLFHQQLANSPKTKTVQSIKTMQKLAGLKKRAMEELNQNPVLLHVGDQDDSGSQSQPQRGEVSQKQRNPQIGYPKPGALKTHHKQQSKSKQIKISTKFISTQLNSKQASSSGKMKSQVFAEEELPKKIVEINPGYKTGSTILIENDRPHHNNKVQIKIANSVNTFELDTLRASSLYQKNVRVHSITRNGFDYNSEKSKKVINPFLSNASNQTHTGPFTPQQDKEGRMRINLIHGREGAQYRRVRKLAQENMKRQIPVEDNGKFVKELHGCNLNNNIQLQKNHQGGIAPKFYPVSQQRSRRASLESYIKRQPRLQQFKRISINGDELNVRCFGKHVYL